MMTILPRAISLTFSSIPSVIVPLVPGTTMRGGDDDDDAVDDAVEGGDDAGEGGAAATGGAAAAGAARAGRGRGNNRRRRRPRPRRSGRLTKRNLTDLYAQRPLDDGGTKNLPLAHTIASFDLKEGGDDVSVVVYERTKARVPVFFPTRTWISGGIHRHYYQYARVMLVKRRPWARTRLDALRPMGQPVGETEVPAAEIEADINAWGGPQQCITAWRDFLKDDVDSKRFVTCHGIELYTANMAYDFQEEHGWDPSEEDYENALRGNEVQEDEVMTDDEDSGVEESDADDDAFGLFADGDRVRRRGADPGAAPQDDEVVGRPGGAALLEELQMRRDAAHLATLPGRPGVPPAVQRQLDAQQQHGLTAVDWDLQVFDAPGYSNRDPTTTGLSDDEIDRRVSWLDNRVRRAATGDGGGGAEVPSNPDVDIARLSSRQRLAYDIIARHDRQFSEGAPAEQLLMQVLGTAGKQQHPRTTPPVRWCMC